MPRRRLSRSLAAARGDGAGVRGHVRALERGAAPRGLRLHDAGEAAAGVRAAAGDA